MFKSAALAALALATSFCTVGCAADTEEDALGEESFDSEETTEDSDELVKQVKAGTEDVFVRDEPQGVVIGRLYSGEHFDVDPARAQGTYVSGMAKGQVQRCGFVPQSSFKNVSNRATGSCTVKNPSYNGNTFWSITLSDGRHDGKGFRLCRDTQTWDNWDFASGQPRPKSRGTIRKNTLIKLRYRTSDGNGLVLRDNALNWVFVRWADVRKLPWASPRERPLR